MHPQIEDYRGSVNPIGPRDCYDERKRCAEKLFFDYHKQHKLRIKLVRIFNIYGPWMHPNDGRWYPTSSCRRYAVRTSRFVCDGLQTRAFCYVSDLIDELIRMMATPDEMTGQSTPATRLNCQWCV